MTDPALTRAAEHCVADALCAIHAQLRAVLRGDADAAQAAHHRAMRATAGALDAARAVLRGMR